MANNSGFALTKNQTIGSGVLSDIGDFFGIGTARREREWQESMANTQYQRAVADMKEAGLNPAMMYAGGSNMQASAGHSAAAAANAGGALGQISSVVNSAAQLLAVNNVGRDIDSKIGERASRVGSYGKDVVSKVNDRNFWQDMALKRNSQNAQIVNSAAKMIQTAQFLSKMLG